jgi:ABC-type sugar transport system permease subunit
VKRIKSKKFRSLEARRAWTGFYFILPWIIGIVLFFLSPLVQSILFSFSDVKLADGGGLDLNFVGLENYKYIFFKDGGFNQNLGWSMSEFAYSMPIIVILSLVFACVLNQKFKGRLFARALFFMPVIIASGVVMQIINSTGYGEPVSMSLGSTNSYMGDAIDFSDVLGKMGFTIEIIEFFSRYISRIFTLIWSIGVQTILFISGLQTIPAQLYEVSKVEGASKWEEFWYITVPMLKNIIFLVIVYTMVELCLANDNSVITQAYNLMQVQVYGRSSAMLWVYFLATFAFSGVILLAYNRLCMKRWE